ncbi:MAG: hypothetical protein JST93_09295 [Acidobacteria bacterium]|nr:hypothetical protein [Acidobacteriota bacterium]
MQTREWVTATASRDTAPRVGLIPSFFAGAEEMDGKKIRGLVKPAPLDAEITGAQLEDMLRLAVELGGGRRGGLATAIGREDWVVLKVHVPVCGEGATDVRMAAFVLRYLAERRLGKRFTVVEHSPCGEAMWAPYRAVVLRLEKEFRAMRFELVDLNEAPRLRMPVEGRVMAKRNAEGIYDIPRVLRECDKVISIAPLAAGTVMNYLSFGGRREWEEPGESAVDLYSFHPADYAILGSLRPNVVIAGTNGPAVDAVGAAVRGVESTSVRHLELAVQRGYGLNDASAIWTRGAELEEVKATLR